MNCKIWSDNVQQASEVRLQLEQWSTQLAFSDFGDTAKWPPAKFDEDSYDVHFICVLENDGTLAINLAHFFSANSILVFILSTNSKLRTHIELAGLDYLVWPINMNTTREIESRLNDLLAMSTERDFFFNGYRGAIHFLDARCRQGDSDEIVLPDVRGYAVYRKNDIVRLESEGPYSAVTLVNGSIVLTNKSVRHFEVVLEESGFVRISNEHLINLHYLEGYIRESGLKLILKDGTRLQVSMRWIPLVLDELSKWNQQRNFNS